MIDAQTKRDLETAVQDIWDATFALYMISQYGVMSRDVRLATVQFRIQLEKSVLEFADKHNISRPEGAKQDEYLTGR